MGGYDLYGRYYSNVNDAINAEIAQCNEIDNRLNAQRLDDLERKMYEERCRKEYEMQEQDFEIHYALEQFEDIKSEYFDEDGNLYSGIIVSSNIMEMMHNLIKMLKKERKKIDNYD